MRFWVVVMLLLAGCAEAPPETEDPFSTPPAETTETLGAISGVVVDATILPIAGANVSIGAESRTTDEAGAFVFEGLEPGVYFITVKAEQFEPSQTSVQVDAGQVAKARIQLLADTSPIPVAVTDKFDAWMEFSDFYVVYILTDIIGPNELCECKFETAKQDNLETVIVEAHWESSMTRVDGHNLYWDVFSDTSSWQGGWATSPTHFRFDESSFIAEDPSMFVLVSSDIQPDVGQAIEIFMTQFSNADAPEDWSLIGDA